VTVNGTALGAADLVARARSVQAAFAAVERQVVSVTEAGERVEVAFRMGGLHVGPLQTSAGPLPPTSWARSPPSTPSAW
jgi:hypothetical protein